ncbi:hypothetical protein ACJVC5_08400 [Peredibacter sp. HCB2-198]|uniref:hypothetical protein n=1 Tax=Peredibacter sp. HCB2-198 TaxID=3383025 RepID=UPI0038B509CF
MNAKLSANRDLATLYMIGSIHESYTICEPFGENKKQEWGNFIPPSEESIHKIIFWDGTIKNTSYLYKAIHYLKEDTPQEKAYDEHDKLKLGWIYERLGETKKAILLLEETFKTESQKIDKSFACKEGQCGELMATVESLQLLHRIYQKKGDKKKMKEYDQLIKYYEKKRIFSDALI